jgi:hypothetical protein
LSRALLSRASPGFAEMEPGLCGLAERHL